MVLIAALALVAASAPATANGKAPRVTIRTTSHGIPHILADSWKGLGYGYGFAFAKQNLCTIADSYVTVNADRSRFFGPNGSWVFRGNGFRFNNLDSDFFFQKLIDEKVADKLLALPPPKGPKAAIKKIAKGYAAGYNRYLRRVGVANLPDPRCRGEEWVRPIGVDDVYRRFYALGLLASQGVAIDGIAAAAPPSPRDDAASREAPVADAATLRKLDQRLHPDIGSNAYGLGREATRTGGGMLLGNPHFPWEGSERFFQSQLTIPGKINVSGASLFGVPLINIGHTRRLAWSHTVSTAYRFTPVQETLVPGSPTTYLVDGQPRQMERRTVTVKVKGDSGSLSNRSHTFYSTIHGPVITSLVGLPAFPWTPLQATAMHDANADNFRYLNHFFDVNRAKTVAKLHQILITDQGVPGSTRSPPTRPARPTTPTSRSCPTSATQRLPTATPRPVSPPSRRSGCRCWTARARSATGAPTPTR